MPKPLLVFMIAAQAAGAALWAQDPVPVPAGKTWSYRAAGASAAAARRYDLALPFSEGLAQVCLQGRCGFIDTNFAPVIACKYQSADRFSQGVAPVKMKGAWGFIDKAGNEVIPFIYEEAGPASEGVATVKQGGRLGLLEISSKTFISTPYEEIGLFTGGLALVKSAKGYGFIDKSGAGFLPAVYDELYPFDGDYAPARLRDQYGFVNRRTLAFKAKGFIGIGALSSGLAPVQTLAGEGLCGYADPEGKMVLAPDYAMCAAFSEGLAPVRRDFKTGWGFIAATGEVVIPFKYDRVSPFVNGIAKVAAKGRVFYIDRSGNEYLK